MSLLAERRRPFGPADGLFIPTTRRLVNVYAYHLFPWGIRAYHAFSPLGLLFHLDLYRVHHLCYGL